MQNLEEIELRRQLAAKLDLTPRSDYLVIANVKPSTEESNRKRGTAPPYVIIGKEIHYTNAGLKATVEARTRMPRSAVPAKELL